MIPISTSAETKIPSSCSLSCQGSPQHQDEVIIMQDEGFHLTDPRGSLTWAEAQYKSTRAKGLIAISLPENGTSHLGREKHLLS